MANFPVFHGITLAANSYIENLNVEILTTDPVPVGPGRIWFNSVEKVIKFSGLNSSGAVIVRSFKDAESAAAELASLTSDYQAADASEAIARISGDAATLQSAKDYSDIAEAAAKTYADGIKADILGGIPPEVLDTITELAAALNNNPDILDVLGTQIGGVQTSVDNEVTRAQAAEAALDARVSAAISTAASATSAESTRAQAAEGALGTRVTAVESEVSGKIGTLSGLTTDNKSSLVAAINEVDSNADAAQSTANAAVSAASAEAVRAQAAESALGVRVDGAISSATSAIAAEASARAAGDLVSSNAIATEKARAEAAEGVLTSAIAAEATAARAAESALGVRVDGAISSAAAAVASEANARVAGDLLNSNAIATEKARAEAAESVLTSAIAAEATTARAAESANASAIASESVRAQAAEGVNTAAISAESTRAQAAESANAAAISAESTRAQVAESGIKSDYNNTVFTYQSNSAATVHTINHSLNNGFVDVSIQVERSNGKYYNDIVSVEEFDNNTVKVYLSTALKVKAICRSAKAL